MKQLTSWFKSAVNTLLDPDREGRVQALVDAIHLGIQNHGQRFVIHQGLIPQDYTQQELNEAKIRVYKLALERGWTDGVLTPAEAQTTQWLAARLELPPDEVRQLNVQQARRHFGMTLARAMDDGVLNPQEQERLASIAAAVGSTLPQFARAFFQNEGESFLRSIFLACVADNRISDSDWNYLLQVTALFGLHRNEMLAAIQPQALQFVERVVADSKSDGKISSQEEQSLQWLLANLQLPPDFCAYVQQEIQLVRTLSEIDEGRLPSIRMPAGLEHRSGEIIHWCGSASWREHRVRRGEVYAASHPGILVITDNRLIFSSSTKSLAVGYRRIVAHTGTHYWMEVQLEGKPVSQFEFHQPSAVAYAIFRTALAMANQTKLAKLDANTRHIPRDVRQRVWQRYGGRCAECSATTYLEFDHVIPVARGGSNTDANVQLLCRMCNQKKSDHI